MEDLHYLEFYAKERQREMVHEAKMVRLRNLSRKKGPGVIDRISIWIGDFLISHGKRIKKRYCLKSGGESDFYGTVPDRIKGC